MGFQWIHYQILPSHSYCFLWSILVCISDTKNGLWIISISNVRKSFDIDITWITSKNLNCIQKFGEIEPNLPGVRLESEPTKLGTWEYAWKFSICVWIFVPPGLVSFHATNFDFWRGISKFVWKSYANFRSARFCASSTGAFWLQPIWYRFIV